MGISCCFSVANLWIILLILTAVNSNNIQKREVALSSSLSFSNLDEYSFEKKLVLHYTFDNSDDIIQNKAYDDSNYDNHGTFRNGALIINIPKSTCKNAAYLFSADIKIDGTTFQAKPMYGLTIATWLILLEKQGPRSVFEIYGEKRTHPSYHLEINSNLLYWYHRNPNSQKQIFSVVAEGIKTRKWTHIAATYNQTTGIGQLFINGIPYNRTVGRGQISRDWSSLVRVGNSDTSGQLGGFLDDFRIYNYALHVSDIVDVMNNCSFAEKGPNTVPKPAKVPAKEKRDKITGPIESEPAVYNSSLNLNDTIPSLIFNHNSTK